ncbi:hypothetical protein ACSSS7_007280 [Eimeria intestinalis]
MSCAFLPSSFLLLFCNVSLTHSPPPLAGASPGGGASSCVATAATAATEPAETAAAATVAATVAAATVAAATVAPATVAPATVAAAAARAATVAAAAARAAATSATTAATAATTTAASATATSTAAATATATKTTAAAEEQQHQQQKQQHRVSPGWANLMERGMPSRQPSNKKNTSFPHQSDSSSPSFSPHDRSAASKKQRKSPTAPRGVKGAPTSAEPAAAAAAPANDQQQQQRQHELLQELLPRVTNSSERAPQINVCMHSWGFVQQVDCCLRYPGLPPIRTFAVSRAPLADSPVGPPSCGGPPRGGEERGGRTPRLRARDPPHPTRSRIDRARQAATMAVLEAALCLPEVTVQLGEPPRGAPPETNGRASSERGEEGGPHHGRVSPEATHDEVGLHHRIKNATAAPTHASLRGPLPISVGGPGSKRLRGERGGAPQGRPPLPLVGAPLSPARGPLLVLLGGSSGSGKSTLLPLLLQLLCRTFTSLEGLPSWNEQGGGPRPYVLLSTDALRQILRVLYPVKEGAPKGALRGGGGPQGCPPDESLVRRLLFSSTYDLKDLATRQLQSSTATPTAAATATATAAAAAAAAGAGAGAAGASAGAAGVGEEGHCVERVRDYDSLREQIEGTVNEELGAPMGAPAHPPILCGSCGEEAPCCALLGMLQQAVLLQQVILEPLVKSLMGPPEGGGPAKSQARGEVVGGGPPESQARGKEGPSQAQQTWEMGGGPLKLVLVEGVHLTPAFSARMQRLYGSRCLSLVAYCFSKEEHARRLANREEGHPTNAVPAGPADAAAVAAAAAAETAAAAATAETVVAAAVAEGFGAPSSTLPEGRLKGGGPQQIPDSIQGAPKTSSSSSSSNKYVRALACIRCVQLHLCLAAASTLATSSSSSSMSSKSSSLLRSNEGGFFLSEASAAAAKTTTAAGGQQGAPPTAAEALGSMLLGAPQQPLQEFPRIYAVPTDDLPTSLRLVHQAALAQWGGEGGGAPSRAPPSAARVFL